MAIAHLHPPFLSPKKRDFHKHTPRHRCDQTIALLSQRYSKDSTPPVDVWNFFRGLDHGPHQRMTWEKFLGKDLNIVPGCSRNWDPEDLLDQTTSEKYDTKSMARKGEDRYPRIHKYIFSPLGNLGKWQFEYMIIMLCYVNRIISWDAPPQVKVHLKSLLKLRWS